jgi:AcrR family transcriptional regulator
LNAVLRREIAAPPTAARNDGVLATAARNDGVLATAARNDELPVRPGVVAGRQRPIYPNVIAGKRSPIYPGVIARRQSPTYPNVIAGRRNPIYPNVIARKRNPIYPGVIARRRSRRGNLRSEGKFAMTTEALQNAEVELRTFRRETGASLNAICREIFAEAQIQVRNEKIAVHNLGRIIEATLAIANRKGFAAMSLRDLAKRAGLSLGGLYAYIRSKDDLAALIQTFGGRQTERVLRERLAGIEAPDEKLAEAIRTHLYLSEVLRPWFFFLYMEAQHLAPNERKQAVAMERATEKLFADIIVEGQSAGRFRAVDPTIAAGMLKALLQDWYLKHRKHTERGLDVTAYAEQLRALMERYLE